MSAYVTLFNWTEQGISNVRDTTKRAKAAREAWEAAGGRWIGIWWTQGQYDGVIIHETPDEETATRLLMSVGMTPFGLRITSGYPICAQLPLTCRSCCNCVS